MGWNVERGATCKQASRQKQANQSFLSLLLQSLKNTDDVITQPKHLHTAHTTHTYSYSLFLNHVRPILSQAHSSFTPFVIGGTIPSSLRLPLTFTNPRMAKSAPDIWVSVQVISSSPTTFTIYHCLTHCLEHVSEETWQQCHILDELRVKW